MDWMWIDPEEKEWTEVVSDRSGSENAFSSCDSPSDSEAPDVSSFSLSCHAQSDQLFRRWNGLELTDRFIPCFRFAGQLREIHGFRRSILPRVVDDPSHRRVDASK